MTAAPRPLLEQVVVVLLGLILSARLLVPTEGAVLGDSLWIVQLCFAAAALWGWHCWRQRRFEMTFGLFDLALWLLVGGHVVSALSVLVAGGQQRAAVNMLWEWLALGATGWLIRQVIRTRAAAVRVIVVMLAMTAALAGLGLWQHYVWYPAMVEEYQSIRGPLDRLLAQGQSAGLSPQDQQQVHDLQFQLTQQDIPLEAPGRQLWEARLAASSEPFGTFALANTFAGLLVTWLFASAGVLWSALRQDSRLKQSISEPTLSHRASPTSWGAHWTVWIAPAVAVLLIAYCLLLTKSRTAWVGLLAGLCVWAVTTWLRRHPQTESRSALKWAVGGAAALAVFATLAAASGGLDRAVVSEAPKSLRYRLQYWTGAWEVVREHPWLGVGPGNFRPHYLHHKLPESSEEIADPHNLVLDVWTSGGLLGVAGLGLFVMAGGAALLRRSARPEMAPAAFPDENGSLHRSPFVLGSGLSYVVLLGTALLLGGDWLRWPILLAGWLLGLFGLQHTLLGIRETEPSQSGGNAPKNAPPLEADPDGPPAVSPACLAAGFAALLVHLLGAGGIEMPAIVQTLILLPMLALAAQAPAKHESRPQPAAAWPPLVVGLVALALFAGCLMTATLPVWNRTLLIATGDSALMVDGSFRRAEAHYREAAKADRLSPEPVERLANLYFQQWQSGGAGGGAEFERAVEWQQRAQALDPENPFPHARLGEMYLACYRRDQNAAAAEAAVAALRQAVAKYPHSAALRSQLARAEQAAGDDSAAVAQARRAAELDRINRREGHTDKYLPPDRHGLVLIGRWALDDAVDAQRLGEATEVMEAAAELFPQNASIRADLVRLLQKLGKQDESRRRANEALQLDQAATSEIDRLSDSQRRQIHAILE